MRSNDLEDISTVSQRRGAQRDRRGGRGHRHGGGGGRRGRGRAPRGDVRAAVLLLLDEEAMHGYQLMQAIAERTEGRWTPSPGAVYPSLRQLEDDGLVDITKESGRKLVTITDAGRAHLEENREEWGDPFETHLAGESGPDLRQLMEQLHGAVRQVGRSGSDAQRTAAAATLSDARRTIYLILADDESATS